MRIKEICKEKGLTISLLADKMGIKQESLSRAINGNPTLKTLEQIASALEVNIIELFSTSKNDVYGFISINGVTHTINNIGELKSLLKGLDSKQE